MLLTEENKQNIRNLAANQPNEEICGLIVNSQVFPCKNVAIEPDKSFVLSPLDYLNASKKGKITTIYHSHLTTKTDASIIDRDSASKHNLPIITYNLKLDTFDVFSQNMGISHSGKWFKLGKSDCFTLLRGYYKEELGIELPEIKDIFQYSSRSDLFSSPELFGFYDVPSKQQHDVLISRQDDTNHILIYLGYNKVLHQPMNAESLIEDLGSELSAKITQKLRHESFIRTNPEKLLS